MRRRYRMAALVMALLLTLSALPEAAFAAVRPTGVSLNRTQATINLASAKYLTLRAKVAPTGASQKVVWTSSNASVATVNSVGKVTALKPGTTTITARADRTNVKATCLLTVTRSAAPTSIRLSTSSLSLSVGGSRQLSASVLPAAANQSIKWKTSNGAIAAVSANGLVTAKGVGTATITAYSAAKSTVQATARVTVSRANAPTSIAIASPADTLAVGERMQFTSTVLPAGAGAGVTWKVNTTTVATITSGGVLTAKRAGTVYVICTSAIDSDVYARKRIVVTAAGSASIRLSDTALTVAPGTTAQVTAEVLPASADQTVRWISSATGVATVSASGVITAKGVGTATITAYWAKNTAIRASLKLTVKQLGAPTALEITAEADNVDVGGKLQLTATPTPKDASSLVTWATSSTKIATIDANGLLTGVSGGYVTVTATSKVKSSVTATYRVLVNDGDMPTSIAITPSTATLEVTEALELSASVKPAAASQSVKWGTNTSTVATISADGVLTARAAGTVRVMATSVQSPTVKTIVTFTVVNRAKPSRINLSIPTKEVAIGASVQLSATPYPSTASRLFVYASSNKAVATVSDTGVITGVKEGTATITVTSKRYSAVKGSVTVTVYNPQTPTSLKLSTYTAVLGVNDSLTIKPTVLPAGASQTVKWSTSDKSVATVNESGKVVGVGAGIATITCQTAVGGLKATASITVLETTLTTAIPERTTDIGGISLNLAKIEAIRRSAVNQILREHAANSISSAEASDRTEIVNRAFAMQAFPWMTTTTQEYWSKAYAYKRYVPGNVYYGLPYIQSGPSKKYLNRRYNVTKAVEQGYYTSSGKGYYLMSRSKFLDGMYVGNDCSAFVSMSQWGTSHSASYSNTTAIAGSSYYKTISSWDNLRPGDLLVKGGHHTVLFLYYANSAKTKMMIIEQGGNGNTVICSLYDRTYYSSRSYVARRKTTFR